MYDLSKGPILRDEIIAELIDIVKEPNMIFGIEKLIKSESLDPALVIRTACEIKELLDAGLLI